MSTPKSITATICYPNGTPIPSMLPKEEDDNNQGTTISVASFNLLAPCYVRPLDKRTGEIQPFAMFDWVKDDKWLDWDHYRKEQLLNYLQSCQANVICLQELQMERCVDSNKIVLPHWIQPMIQQYGYEAFLPSQLALDRIAERNVRVLDIDAAVTCAVLVRVDSSSCWIPCQESFQKVVVNNHDSTCVSVCLYHSKDYDTIDPIVVTSIHLDASDESKRVTQLSQCFKRARTLLSETATVIGDNKKVETESKNLPVNPLTTIIAGDLNTECMTGSAVACFLDGQQLHKPTDQEKERECALSLRLSPETRPSKDQLKEWNELHDTVYQTVYDDCLSSCLARVNSGPTRCAYSHDEEGFAPSNLSAPTTTKTMAQWKLDHVFYTTHRLHPISRWSTLEDDPESCQIGLPNHKCPSDHLPLATMFQVLPKVNNHELSPQDKQSLSHQLRSLLEKQTKALTEMDQKLEQELQAIQVRLAAQEQQSNNDQESKSDKIQEEENNNSKKRKKKTKKNQKKGPPPQEVIDCIRKKRTVLNQMREDYQSERQELVKDWNDFQRLVIQEEFEMSCREWVQQRL